jgi:uncharacterized protein involved in exopolysaccharide biosynthesis
MVLYDLRYWLELLRRRKRIALQVGILLFGLIVLGTLAWPPTYQSTAKILVQGQREQYIVSPDLQDDQVVKQAVVSRPITQEDLNSEVELFTSTYLIEAALEGLQPPSEHQGAFSSLLTTAGSALDFPQLGYDSLHNTPSINAMQSWALKLERHLHPSVIKMSNIIEVSFSSHNQLWSQEFLNRLLDKYLEYHAKLSSDPQAAKFFDQQALALQSRLEASENALRDFELKHSITDVQAQKQALVTRFSDLQIQHNRVGADVAANREQVVAFAERLRATPEHISKETRSVQNQSLQQLKPQVMQMKAERAELLSRYQPTSQRIQEIDAKIAAAQTILDAENHLEVQEKSSDINPVWLSLDTGLEQAKVNLASNGATLEALGKEIENIEVELNQLTTNAVAMGRLQRQVDADKEAYQSYVRKSEEARTAQALNSSRILNVSMAQSPSLPLKPVYPKVWFNLLVGLVLATALAVGAAYWEEQHDDVLYSPISIAEASGLKTVAILGDEA